MSRAASRSRMDKKLSHQSSTFQLPVSTNTALARAGCSDQDWNFVIEKEKSEDVVQEIIRDILFEMDSLVLHRYVQHSAVEYAVERIKDDLIHMCEWLYAKRDVEVDECYFINLDDEEPLPLDMDSLGSGSLPSMCHIPPTSAEESSPPITLVLHQSTPVTNICPPVGVDPSMPLTNFKDLPMTVKQDGEEEEEDEEEKEEKQREGEEDKQMDKSVEKSKSPESHTEGSIKSQRRVTIGESPFVKIMNENAVISIPVTNLDDVGTEAAKHTPLLHRRKKRSERTRSQPFEKRVPINFTVRDQIYHLQTAKDSRTYKEIVAYRKSMKDNLLEMIPVEPHPATINSINLSEGVSIFQLEEMKANPIQAKEAKYKAIKLEKSKDLQPVPQQMRGITEPLLSTKVKVNPQPLTLPPISRDKKNSRTIC